jgi:hypothetical protein
MSAITPHPFARFVPAAAVVLAQARHIRPAYRNLGRGVF